jgi:hypothetical protein
MVQLSGLKKKRFNKEGKDSACTGLERELMCKNWLLASSSSPGSYTRVRVQGSEREKEVVRD